MVKNTAGGSRHKSQARKNVVSRGGRTTLRVVEEEGECYAQVEKLLGGSNCHVVGMDGRTLLCHIRGKFRGRGKRDNRLEIGTWVMVGVRDYETSIESSGKLDNCDLLEVYKDTDKERLRSSVRADWDKFIARDHERSHLGTTDHDGFEFITEEEEEMENLIIQSSKIPDVAKEDEEEGGDKEESEIGVAKVSALGDDDSDIDINDI
jgi:translation initiation factor IF-1